MFQFVTGRGGRSTPGSRLWPRLTPVALALALLVAPGAAGAQTAPAPAPAAPTQTAPQTPPPAKGEQPQEAPPKGPPGEGKGRNRNRPPAAPAADAADLESVMHGLKDNAKLLNGALASDDGKVALSSVIEMERLAVLAKKFEPNNMAAMPEADKPAHIVAFRKELIALVKQLTDIETLVLDGKFAPALELMKGPLADMREDAHDKFQAKKERPQR